METTKTLLDSKYQEFQEGRKKEVRTYKDGKLHGEYGTYQIVKTIKYSDTIIVDGIEVMSSAPTARIDSKLVHGCFYVNGKRFGQEMKNSPSIAKEIVANPLYMDNTITKQVNHVSSSLRKIPHRVIALKYRYLKLAGVNNGITLENRDKIAADHGWNNKNSGRKIYNYFNVYLTELERTTSTLNRDELNYCQTQRRIIKYLQQVVEELASSSTALDIVKKELAKTKR